MSAAFSRPLYRSTVDRHVGHVAMETSQPQPRTMPLIKETDMWLSGGTHLEWKYIRSQGKEASATQIGY